MMSLAVRWLPLLSSAAVWDMKEGGYEKKNLSQPFTATWFYRAAKLQLMKEFLMSAAEDQNSSGVNSQSSSGLELG